LIRFRIHDDEFRVSFDNVFLGFESEEYLLLYRVVVPYVDTILGFVPLSTTLMTRVRVAYEIDYDLALKLAITWPTTMMPKEKRENVWDPRELEALVGLAEERKIKQSWLITTDSE
jgi:hypothetical protein